MLDGAQDRPWAWDSFGGFDAHRLGFSIELVVESVFDFCAIYQWNSHSSIFSKNVLHYKIEVKVSEKSAKIKQLFSLFRSQAATAAAITTRSFPTDEQTNREKHNGTRPVATIIRRQARIPRKQFPSRSVVVTCPIFFNKGSITT